MKKIEDIIKICNINYDFFILGEILKQRINDENDLGNVKFLKYENIEELKKIDNEKLVKWYLNKINIPLTGNFNSDVKKVTNYLIKKFLIIGYNINKIVQTVETSDFESSNIILFFFKEFKEDIVFKVYIDYNLFISTDAFGIPPKILGAFFNINDSEYNDNINCYNLYNCIDRITDFINIKSRISLYKDLFLNINKTFQK